MRCGLWLRLYSIYLRVECRTDIPYIWSNHFDSIHITHAAVNLYRFVVNGHGRPGDIHMNRNMIYVHGDSKPRFHMVEFHFINLPRCANDKEGQCEKNIKYTWARYAWVQHKAIFIFSWPLFFSYVSQWEFMWQVLGTKLARRSNDVKRV